MGTAMTENPNGPLSDDDNTEIRSGSIARAYSVCYRLHSKRNFWYQDYVRTTGDARV